ncbi:hypothetical protein OIU85_003596 [Salix viminalis]|uniref:NB-ARC domain-containing protein n=1 Tax=Salix viminalis TaxID=40686 RepID=A0A9Q0PZI4_SALVM|nr:hypothetical protein OIU85_003596 [Salix viminalis]
MASFLLLTCALEQMLKLGLLGFEEIDTRYLKRSVKALKEVLPSVQALLQDTVASRLSGDFLDIQKHVEFIEYLSQDFDTAAYNDRTVGAAISQDFERVDDVLKIVEFLKGSSTNHQLLHVFPIVGMAGLGKTALARLVCEAVSEGQLFDETVWISVSDNGEDMAGEADSIGETLEHLSKELQGKRFLLVLDDVWNEDVDNFGWLKGFLCNLMIRGWKIQVKCFSISLLIVLLLKLWNGMNVGISEAVR